MQYDLKDYATYKQEMTMNYKPEYLIYALRNNGPDDAEWEEYGFADTLVEATNLLMSLHNAGHTAKLFDPFTGQEFAPSDL